MFIFFNLYNIHKIKFYTLKKQHTKIHIMLIQIKMLSSNGIHPTFFDSLLPKLFSKCSKAPYSSILCINTLFIFYNFL